MEELFERNLVKQKLNEWVWEDDFIGRNPFLGYLIFLDSHKYIKDLIDLDRIPKNKSWYY